MTSSIQNNTTKECNNIDEEFYSRMLCLFASCYEEPTIEPISTFPPAPPIQTQTEKQKKLKTGMPQNFSSRICDLRLIKQVDEFEAQKIEAHDKLTNEIENKESIFQLLETDEQSNTQDLIQIFAKEKAPRPEVPKYIQEIRADQKKEQELRNIHKNNLFDPLKSEKQYKIQMEKQNQRTMERKKKIYEKQKEYAKTHKDFLNTLPKTTNYEEKYPKRPISPKIQQNKDTH